MLFYRAYILTFFSRHLIEEMRCAPCAPAYVQNVSQEDLDCSAKIRIQLITAYVVLGGITRILWRSHRNASEEAIAYYRTIYTQYRNTRMANDVSSLPKLTAYQTEEPFNAARKCDFDYRTRFDDKIRGHIHQSDLFRRNHLSNEDTVNIRIRDSAQ